MEDKVRGLVGEPPRTAWVAVAADDMAETALAAAVVDQEGVSGKRVVFMSLRRAGVP